MLWDTKTSFHLHNVAYDHALRHKDVFPSSQRSLWSRSYRQCSFARTSSPRSLSISRLCFGSTILGAYASIHPFSSSLSMLSSHRDQWEACVAAWRFVHIVGDRRRRKDEGRKRYFFFAIAAPQDPKVRTEGERSLCFLVFSWFLGLTKP